MPTPTYIPLGTITLSATDTTILFSNIPQTYRDLIIVQNAIGGVQQDGVTAINGSSSNFTGVRMFGNGSSTGSNTYTDSTGITTSLTSRNVQINHIFDYSATDKHKTILTVLDGSGFAAMRWAHRWASTAAITSISFTPLLNQWQVGSTFSLYGIH